jgi:putative phosphoribosyl transferase
MVSVEKHSIRISARRAQLDGDLMIPPNARGVVLFAHGSGSDRHSLRNQAVAQLLCESEPPIGTLLVDLLTKEEGVTDRISWKIRFDIGFLANRLLAITDWLAAIEPTRSLPIGYFGASTGAAAALVAAAERPHLVHAIVSRGGRPDLVAGILARVVTPTLLVVGSKDVMVLELNRRARRALPGECRLAVIDGAGHSFEEPGKLLDVARHATRWFQEHLDPRPGRAAGEQHP